MRRAGAVGQDGRHVWRRGDHRAVGGGAEVQAALRRGGEASPRQPRGPEEAALEEDHLGEARLGDLREDGVHVGGVRGDVDGTRGVRERLGAVRAKHEADILGARLSHAAEGAPDAAAADDGDDATRRRDGAEGRGAGRRARGDIAHPQARRRGERRHGLEGGGGTPRGADCATWRDETPGIARPRRQMLTAAVARAPVVVVRVAVCQVDFWFVASSGVERPIANSSRDRVTTRRTNSRSSPNRARGVHARGSRRTHGLGRVRTRTRAGVRERVVRRSREISLVLVDFGREISRGGTCRRGIAKRRIRRALVRSVITRPLRETHARFSGDGAAHR